MKSSADDMVDLKQLFVNVVGKWKYIASFGVVLAFVSGLYSTFIVKPLYVSRGQLIPTKGGGEVQLAAAAALMGSRSSGNDAELFQQLLNSRKVARRFVNSNCPDSSGKGMKVIATTMGVDTSSASEMDDAIEYVSKSVGVDVDVKGGISLVEFSFSADSPWFAKQGGSCLLLVALDAFNEVKSLRYKVSANNLNFAVHEAYQEWQIAAAAVAEFKDRNRSIILPSQELDLSKLEIEKNAKEQKYLIAKREQEEMNFNSIKASDPMIIIDSLEMPRKKAKPNRRMYVFAAFFFGVVLSSIFFALKLGDRNLR